MKQQVNVALDEHPFEDEIDARGEERWDLEQGDEIAPGRFALTKLGGGHAYEAYLAWDDHLSFLVVAKLLRPHLVDDADSLRALAREADVLDRLRHPLVVRGFGAVSTGARPHLLMEYLEGPHLARLIRKGGPLALEQFVPLAIHLCSAVQYMANERVVHLDIKPRNIVVANPPKVIDLSVARSSERAQKIRGRIGTDLYMAPEQCEPEELGPIGSPADVWGLGVTLYQSIAAKLPFSRPRDYEREEPLSRFPQLGGEPAPLPKSVPAALAEVILSCLQDDPSSRPKADEVAAMLEPFVARLPRRPVLGLLRPRLRGRR